MDGKELKKIWRSDQPSFGSCLTSIDPGISAAMCNAGFEWLIIDTEHCCFNDESLRTVIMMIKSRNVVPIVRVIDNNVAIIKKVLDFGAEGILVPMIQTPDDAYRAIAACHYPPKGIRGFAPRVASDYYKNIEHYVQTIDERVISILQIENIKSVSNIDEILKIPGIDCLIIGPADLSYSMGIPLQFNNSRLKKVITKIIAKANTAKIPIGIAYGSSIKDFKQQIEQGANLHLVGSDCYFIELAGKDMLKNLCETTGGR